MVKSVLFNCRFVYCTLVSLLPRVSLEREILSEEAYINIMVKKKKKSKRA